MFKALKTREPISKLIAEQIENAIIDKNYPPGSKLPSENELCKQFGVSRTSVREALGALEAQGMIEIIKGKGMFVKQISTDTVSNSMHKYLQLSTDRHYVLDLVHSRQIIEPGIAYYAALNHTDDDIAALQETLDNLKTVSGDFEVLSRIDNAFHMGLAKASKNIIMPLILAPIHKMLPQIKSSIYAAVEDAKGSALIWHQKIFDAVVSKDPDAARLAMQEHLLIAEQHAEKMLAAQEKKSE